MGGVVYLWVHENACKGKKKKIEPIVMICLKYK